MNAFFKLAAAAAAVLLLTAAISLLRPFADYGALEGQSLADPLATETAVFKFTDTGKSQLQRVVQCRTLGIGSHALITRCQRSEGGDTETLWRRL